MGTVRSRSRAKNETFTVKEYKKFLSLIFGLKIGDPDPLDKIFNFQKAPILKSK